MNLFSTAHGSLNTWLNESLCARVYEYPASENKNQTHPEYLICIRVINERNLGLNNTNSGSTYNMISPRK